jgi:hypothetical protein
VEEVVVEGDHQPTSFDLVEPVQHGPVAFGPGGAARLPLGRHLIPASLEHLDGDAMSIRPAAGLGVGAGSVADQQPHFTACLADGSVKGLSEVMAV